MASTTPATPANNQHNLGDRRGMDAALAGQFGRFGRMFPTEVGIEYAEDALWHLAETMIKADPGQFFNLGDDDENAKIPAAYTYFGQFVDHDITFDKTTIGERESDPAAVQNFRTPRLDLDSVYGSGPISDPHMYNKSDYSLLVGRSIAPPKPGPVQTRNDHIRGPMDRALIGDPRNDENIIVGQIHTAIIAFHNKVITNQMLMDGLTDKWDRFRRAAQITRWHYQWVVVHDFLQRITHPAIYADIVQTSSMPRLRHYPQNSAPCAYMPIEFSAAAYRFGHSMVRPSYALNAVVGVQQTGARRIPIFDMSQNDPRGDLRGFRPMPDAWGIDWGYFLDVPGTAPAKQLGQGVLQPSYRMDSQLVEGLARLPEFAAKPLRQQNLPFRNLMRGSMMRLPSGEQVARRIGLPSGNVGKFPALDPQIVWSAGSRMAGARKSGSDDLDALRVKRAKLAALFVDGNGQSHTPLWYYVLREAEWYATWSPQHPEGQGSGKIKADVFGGHHLGPVGSTIVLETFFGLMAADTASILYKPGWRPMLPIVSDPAKPFGLAELISWALS